MASKSTVSTTIQLLGKLDPSVSQAFDKAQSLVSKAGSGIGKAMSAGFKVAGTAAKAFGAAVAATTAYAIKLGTEYQSASGQIAAATGATGAELEGLRGVMQEVYGNLLDTVPMMNMGQAEQLLAVQNLLSCLYQEWLKTEDSIQEELAAVTEKILKEMDQDAGRRMAG